MAAKSPQRSIARIALMLAMAALGLLMVVVLLTDEIRVSVFGQVLSLQTLRFPLRALIILSVAYCLVDREALASWVGRLAGGDRTASNGRVMIILLIGLIVFGALLRIEDLLDLGLNSVEAFFISTARERSFVDVWRGSLSNVHPPTNYLMLHALLKISWDPTWLRIGSLMAGIYLIWISYRIGREMFGPGAGLCMASLVAFSPNLILLSRIVRNYNPALALMATATFFLIRFYLRGRQRRDLILFGLFEMLSAAWLYSLVVPYLGFALILFIDLIRRRAALREWIVTGAVQVPVGLIFLAAFLLHIPLIEARYFEEVKWFYREEFRIRPHQLLAPFMMVYYYLMGGYLGFVATAGACVSAAALLIQRKFREMTLIFSPIPFALLFAGLERIPIGNLRHSAYLFPFLFLLLAYQVPLFMGGYREVLERVMELRGRLLGKSSLPVIRSTKTGIWGAVLLGVFFFLFLDESLAGLGAPPAERTEVVYGINNVTNIENPVRRVDLEKAWLLLEQNVGKDDIVVPSYGAYLLFHLWKKPGETLHYDPYSPAKFSVGDIRMYYSPEIFWSHGVRRLLTGIREIRKRENLSSVRKIWIPMAGYELYSIPLHVRFLQDAPEIQVESPTPEETRPLLVGLDAAAVEAIDLDSVPVEGVYHDEGFWQAVIPDAKLSREMDKVRWNQN